MAEYMTLEDVLAELQISESKLRELIAAGKIRAFRDQGGEKFRSTDVMALAADEAPEPTVVLPSEPEPEEAEALVPTIELSFEDDASPTSETVIPTIELPTDDETDTDLGDEATDAATEEVALADDEYVILDEDKPGEGGGLDFPDTETDTSDELATDISGAAASLEFEEEPAQHTLFTVLLGFGAVILLATAYVFIAAIRGDMHDGVKDFFLDIRGWFM